MVLVNRIQKICKAPNCNVKFAGFPASKFCSPECKKKGVFKPDPKYTLIKKETLSLPADVPVIDAMKAYTLKQKVKYALTQSSVLDQVIDNIARKHKYKEPKHFVSHIEDMLTLYSVD